MLMNLIKKNSCLLLLALFACPAVFAQGLGTKATFNTSSNEEPKAPVEYTIGGVAIKGVRYLDEELLLAVAGLEVGSKIKLNNDELISKAIRSLWKQDLFADVKIKVSKVINDKAFLEIQLEERPRLSRYIIKGVKKGETQEIKDKINLVKAFGFFLLAFCIHQVAFFNYKQIQAIASDFGLVAQHLIGLKNTHTKKGILVNPN